MIIRPEQLADRPAVRTVVGAAFPMPAEAQLVDQLRAEGDAEISLVAVDDDVIVGHVMFSRMTAEFRALGLGPVAVLPDRQRSGVGSLLITQGLARAEAGRGEVVLVLAPRLTIGGSVSIRRSRAASPRLTQVHISWR